MADACWKRGPCRWISAMLTPEPPGAADLSRAGGGRRTGLVATALSALFEAAVDVPAALHACGEGRRVWAPYPRIHASSVSDQDWVRATQQQFTPIQISPTSVDRAQLERGARCRGDQAAPGPWSRLRHRQPSHHLAVPALARAQLARRGIGAGLRLRQRHSRDSGQALGAGLVVGVDIDPDALEASRANAAANGVEIQFAAPDRGARRGPTMSWWRTSCPTRCASSPRCWRASTRAGGRIVLAGILDPQAGTRWRGILTMVRDRASRPRKRAGLVWPEREDPGEEVDSAGGCAFPNVASP